MIYLSIMKYIINESQEEKFIKLIEKSLKSSFEHQKGIKKINVTPLDPEDTSDDLFDVWVVLDKDYLESLVLGNRMYFVKSTEEKIKKHINNWFGVNKFFINRMSG
jgi:hypothetical protein